MNEIQRMAVETAMRNMLNKGYVDICAIRKVLEMTGGIPNKEDYQILELLHCVNFKEINPELLRGLPVILQRVLGSESLMFEFHGSACKLMLVVP